MSTNGQIVLEGYDENYQTHDFLWTNGVIIDLGYPSPTLTNFTFEWGMNSAGMIVGNAGGPDGTRAYLYASGHMNDLGILDAPYDAYSTAACVSDTGQIVGLSSDSDGNSHVFIYRAGQMTDLETLGHDKCEPNGINSQGTITGIAYDNNQGFAFVYSNDTATVIGTLPPPYDAYSAGRAINDLGWVTGNSWDTDGIAHAFLFASNSVTDLGSLAFPFDAQTTSIAMNNRGQIVGVGISPDSRGRALVYENGRIDDLNNLVDPTLGWRLIQAQAINDYGQIVGYGKINEAAQDHSFLLNPLAAHSLTVLAAGNGSMTISVSNVLPAETVVLQSSTALTAWSAVATNIADGSTTSFTISIEHTSAARFFRAVVR
jgi:probable HAF family extracellular repeat protein